MVICTCGTVTTELVVMVVICWLAEGAADGAAEGAAVVCAAAGVVLAP